MPYPKNVVFDLVGDSYDLDKYIPLFFVKINGIIVVASLEYLKQGVSKTISKIIWILK